MQSNSQITIEKLKNLLIKKCKDKDRVILAIAGPPASGKSTIAKNISDSFNSRNPTFSSVVGMDGFHYDDTYLIAAGLREKKGSIQTFDFGGLYHTLKRLYEKNEKEVTVPVFDREIEIARAGAQIINSKIPLIIVEGNYLLINSDPWSKLKLFFDLKIFLNVSKDEIYKRLIERWKQFKIPENEINNKIHNNDLPNAEFINAKSNGADYVMVTT